MPGEQRFPFRVVDLTHPLEAAGTRWPGDPETARRTTAIRRYDGYALNEWTVGEHTGTHVGAPRHLSPEGADAAGVTARRLVVPLALVHLTRAAKKKHGYEVTVNDLLAEERAHGPITPGSLVTLVTGWSRRWPEPSKVFAKDRQGRLTHPGFGEEAARWLIDERRVSGLGSDAPGVDPGPDEHFAAGRAVAQAGGVHVENLARLEHVPARGAWVVLGLLPLVGGTGSPARVIALVPRE